MPENTHMLEVVLASGSIVRMTFPTQKKARNAARPLEAKMGHRFRNDPEEQRHLLKGPDGTLMVDVDDVKAVRVLDVMAWEAGVEFGKERESDMARRIAEITAQALKAAGVGVFPAPPAA